MAMRIGVGDIVQIEPGYDAWYEARHPNWYHNLKDSQYVRILGWHNNTPGEERMFHVENLDSTAGCAGIPARFVRLVERSAAEGGENED